MIIIKILIIILISFILIIFNNYQISLNINDNRLIYRNEPIKIDKIYIRTLKRTPDRLNKILKSYYESDIAGIIPYEIIYGIDIKEKPEIINKYKKYISTDIINYIQTKNSNRIPYQPDEGAICNILSYLIIYKKLLNNNESVLIMDDNCTFPINFLIYFNYYSKKIPDDWDILLLSKKFTNKLNKKTFKVNKFIGLKAFIINAQKLNNIINLFKKPIKQHIDFEYSDLSMTNKLNIYLLSIPDLINADFTTVSNHTYNFNYNNFFRTIFLAHWTYIDYKI